MKFQIGLILITIFFINPQNRAIRLRSNTFYLRDFYVELARLWIRAKPRPSAHGFDTGRKAG
jgi:hypothetical protein